MISNDTSMDARLDRILHAFAAAPVPSGLQQRIAATVAQRTALIEEPRPSLLARLFALQPRLALTAISALAVVALLLAVARPHQQQVVLQPQPHTITPHAASTLLATNPILSHHAAVSEQVAASASKPPSPNDSDALALAETFAPSHPAPPLPLSSQEALLQRSMRPGQPIELAELDTRRESTLTMIAAAHERASFRDYVHSLLGPLAAAEAIAPTSPPDDQAATAIEPPPTK